MVNPASVEPVTGKPVAKRRSSPLLTLVTALSVAVVGLQVLIWVQNVAAKHDRDTDFGAFFTGYTMVRKGLGSQLYDFAQQKITQKSVLNGGSYEVGLLPFVNPPHVALIGSPLASLSLRAAYFAWAFVNLVLVLVLAWLLWLLTPSLRRADRWRVILFLVSFPPLLIAFMQGSWSLVLAVGTALFALAWREDSLPLMALSAIALSTKPQYVVLPFVALIVARRWKLLGGAALGGTGVVGLTTVAFGPSVWGAYLHQLGSYGSAGDKYGVNAQAMLNVRGMFVRLIGEGGSDTAAKIGLVAGIIAAVFIWSRPQIAVARQQQVLPGAFAATILLASATSFHAHAQDAVVFTVAAAVAVEAICRNHRFAFAHRVALATACFPLLITINRLTGFVGTLTVVLVAISIVAALRLDRSSSKSADRGTIVPL
jgi:Glycosyltransferase family 87